MSLLRSISTVSSLTLISRVLGFVRDILMAKFLGAGFVSDVFFIAFKFPNFFRRLFAEGAFSAAFVPIYCGLLGSGEEAERRRLADRFAEDALAVLLSVLLLFTVIVQVAMPWVMVLLAPGFYDQPEKFTLAVEFARLTFPYLMLISLVALMAGVLNGLHRFAYGAAAPILLNLALITAMGLFHGEPLITGRALAVTVTAAGVLQLLWMVWGLRRAGFRPRLVKPRLTPRIRELGRVMLPVAFGAGVMQVNLVADIVLSSFLPEGSLSFLYYADRLNQLPIGVVGVAVGTVLLPALSRSLGTGDAARAARQQNRAVEAALLLTLPAAVALAVIPDPLITVLFQRGAFTLTDTSATAAALVAYVIGLPAYVLVKVLTPAYYSRKDTKTPVRCAVTSVAVNIVLNLILMQFLAHVGLALATAIASWLNVALLYRGLAARGHFRVDRRLKGKIVRMAAACAVMAGVLALAAHALAGVLDAGGARAWLALGGLVAAGLAAYLFAARATGAVTLAEAKALFGPRQGGGP